MTFQTLCDALRAGFHIFGKHPNGYVVRREIATESGRRWLLAVVEISRSDSR
ncbi:MAG: hypothetical protein WAJ85_11480 [Candidatus Baltobacteraceae bacterium]